MWPNQRKEQERVLYRERERRAWREFYILNEDKLVEMFAGDKAFALAVGCALFNDDKENENKETSK